MIYVADFETTAKTQYLVEKRTKVYLYMIKSVDGTIENIGTSIEQFFDYLMTIQKNSIVYFHNLSFDGEFILWYLIENGYVNVNGDETMSTKSFSNITTDMGMHYQIKVMLPTDTRIEFKCSYRLMPLSIENIGKMVGVNKLKENHNYEEIKNYETLNHVPQEELKYIQNDVEILRKLILKLDEFNITDMTMSSSSYSNWKKTQYTLAKSFVKPDDPYVNDIIDKSYKGGITMLNPQYVGKVFDDVISYDVNSLYPSQMLSHSMPYGEPRVFDTIKEAKKEPKHKKFIYVVYVYRMVVLDGYHPFIGLSSGFTFSSYAYDPFIEDTTLYLWEEEFKLFDDFYYGDYEIVRVLAFRETNNVFTQYLNGWKQIKETTKDGVEKQIAKLMMNSLYGKFGQKDARTSKKLIGTKDDGKVLNYEIVESQSPYKYRPIASYITSMSRCVLIKAIQMNANHFVYCDTDSLYLKDIKKANGITISDNTIGAWKFESHYTAFKCLKAKCYIKTKDDGTIIRSIAGLPKEAQKLVNYDNFEHGLFLKGVKRFMNRVKGGVIIDSTDFSVNVEANFDTSD
jgi:hypothetical protein